MEEDSSIFTGNGFETTPAFIQAASHVVCQMLVTQHQVTSPNNHEDFLMNLPESPT